MPLVVRWEVSETMDKKAHVTWHPHYVDRRAREKLNGHRGCVIWFTGLSGCGKSTLANEVDYQLHRAGIHTFLLDGDNIRHGLNAGPGRLQEYGPAYATRFGLGFSEEDRCENIRRIGAVASLFASAGLITLTAFVSPYRRDRQAVRKRIEQENAADAFIEVFVDAPLEVCESRDPKGLYRKARAGELTGFTGIDAPYESPQHPELALKSAEQSPAALARQVIDFLRRSGLIP
ncbi:MAG: adenylyl-sulfate kinase [Planctomycetota bacterium]